MIISLSLHNVSAASLKITSLKVNQSYGYVNSSLKISANASGGSGTKKYKYYYKVSGKTTIIKNYSTSKSVNFTPKKAGTYTIYVSVKDKKKTITKSKKIQIYSVIKPKISLSTTYLKQNSKKSNGVKISVSATGGYTTKKTNYKYQYTVYKVKKIKVNQTTEKTVNEKIYNKKYSTSCTFTYKPPNEAGTYLVTVSVKDAHSKVSSVSKKFYVCISDLKSSISYNSQPSLGDKVSIVVNGSGGIKDYEYKFMQIDDETGKEIMIDSNYSYYSSNNNLKFIAEEIGGTYQIISYIKDKGGKVVRKPIQINVKDSVHLNVNDQEYQNLKVGSKVKLDYNTDFNYKRYCYSVSQKGICQLEFLKDSKDIYINTKSQGKTEITLYFSYHTQLTDINGQIIEENLNESDVASTTFTVNVIN